MPSEKTSSPEASENVPIWELEMLKDSCPRQSCDTLPILKVAGELVPEGPMVEAQPLFTRSLPSSREIWLCAHDANETRKKNNNQQPEIQLACNLDIQYIHTSRIIMGTWSDQRYIIGKKQHTHKTYTHIIIIQTYILYTHS